MWHSKDPFTGLISIQNFQFAVCTNLKFLTVERVNKTEIFISTPQHVVDHSRPASLSLSLVFFLCIVIVL